MILVVGSSGYIGRFIEQHLKDDDKEVLGTYFKNEIKDATFFDLSDKEISLFDKFPSIKTVIITAATNSNLNSTINKLEESYQTNLKGVKRLIDKCFEKEVFPIYLSSDAVFSGDKGDYLEEDIKNPINEYGKIKSRVENYLQSFGKPYLIIRFGRVFDTKLEHNTILTKLLKDIHAGGRMLCATDQIFTPLHINDLSNFIKLSLREGYTGIFHLASIKKISRYEMAITIRDFFGFNKTEIIPGSIDDIQLPDKRPKDLSLNITKMKNKTHFKERVLKNYLQEIFEKVNKNYSK